MPTPLSLMQKTGSWMISLSLVGALSACVFCSQPEALGLWSNLAIKAANYSSRHLFAGEYAGTFDVLRHLGGTSPWIPKTTGLAQNDTSVPSGCGIDQVHMISRHAERYPTSFAGGKMIALYRRIREANATLQGDLAFVNEWEFLTKDPAGHFEFLVSTGPYAGTLEAFATGVKLRTAYKDLLDHALSQHKISLWAGDSRRVVETAKYFSAGFFGIEWESSADLEIIPETSDLGADTLTPGKTCLNYVNNIDKFGHDYGARMLYEFRAWYLPAIIKRLAEQSPELVFTEDEVYSMQELCGFETIAKGSSEWCSVFTAAEWESFEYARDLLHYYKSGPGNPFGPTMGWLWLNATANLLNEGSSAGTLFFSFVHDGDIIPLLSALDLFPQSPALPTSHVLHDRTWRISDVVPMGGRLIFERLVCPRPQHCWDNGPLYPNHVYCTELVNDVYVRLNVNDGIVALPGCESGPGSSCPLEEFSERVRRRGEELPSFGKLCGLREGAAKRISFLHQ